MRHTETVLVGTALIGAATSKVMDVVNPSTIIGVVASMGLGTIVGSVILVTGIGLSAVRLR